MSVVLAVASGALFGVGLLISGMTQPAKVVGFLDVTGAWDPSLAFVIGGAVAVYAVLFRIVKRRSYPWFAGTFHLPTRNDNYPAPVNAPGAPTSQGGLTR